MTSLIAGNSNDTIQTFINNNELLSKKNSSASTDLNSDSVANADQVGAQSNSSINSSTQVNLSYSQSNSSSLGLYDKYGSLPVPAVNNADGEVNAKDPNSASTDGSFIANGGHVIVDIKNSDSGYNNKIYWSTDNFKTKNYIGVDNNVGSYDIGSFAAGTKIQFGIDNGQGNFFKTGDASSNADNYQHAKSTSTSSGLEIGFEDLYGGGDQDFNDAIINVRNTLSSPENAPKDNRSGLGDGTNPGKGSGTSNSPNQGTNNPGNSVTAAKATQATAKKDAITAAAAKKIADAAAAKKAADEAAAKKIADAVVAKKAAEVAAAKKIADAAAAKKIAEAAAEKKAADAAIAKKAAQEVAAKKATEVAVAKKIADAAAAKKSADAAAAKHAAEEAAAKKVADAAAAKQVVEAAAKKAAEEAAIKKATPPVVASKVNDNRSGLGDGTNPGQGAGKVNSPNTGTNNPGAVPSTADAKLLSAFLKH